MSSYITEESMRDILSGFMEPGEWLDSIARGVDGLGRPYFLGYTDRRILLLELSDRREVMEEESIPLSEIEEYSLRYGAKHVPIDTPLLSSQETVLHVKYKSGRKRKLRITDLFGHRREDAVG